WYPTLYEGQECSPNCIYTGAVPNQQQKDFIPWLVKTYGKRFYLVGSNYVYPKVENNVCKILLKELGGEVLGEEYFPLGHSEFSSVIQRFKETKPDVIFSTVDGDSVVALMRQYKTAGFDPHKVPMASLTTSEEEVQATGGEFAAGNLTSAPYFMSVDTPENHKFVDAYRNRWGKNQLTNFVSEAAYFQVFLFKKAVENLHGKDITPPNIREASWNQTFQAPQGLVKIDPENSNTYLWPKIGEVQPDGQFKIIQQSKEWVEPLPYWPLKGEKCTPTGLVTTKS
ncbi:MAG: transporter substrate-binding protein, partial [Acetobacteraceae bacterium]